MTHRSFPTDSLPGPAFRFPYGPPKNSDAIASEPFFDLRGNLPRPEKVSPGHFFSPAEPGSAFRLPYGPPKNSDADASESFHYLRGNLPRPEKVSPGHFFSPALPGPAFRFPYGPPKNSDAIASEFFGDPYGNRTHVTAVKGRCLNRLTNGPGSGNLVRTDDKPGMNRVLYQLSYTAKSIVSSTAMNSFVIIQDKPPFVKRKMKYFSPFCVGVTMMCDR